VTVDGSFGKYYQIPGLVFMYAVPQNLHLSPIQATHFIAGLSYYPSPDIKVSVEGYVKRYADYPVSVEYPTASLANSGDEYGVADRLFPMVSSGSGTSTGIEFYLQKKLTQRLYGQVSYSYSETRHQALDAVRRPGGFDIPHVLTLVGGYKIGDSWEVSGKFSYASGRPYTPALEPASQQQNRHILDLSRVNAERSPSYSRLDLRVDYRAFFNGWNLVTYIEVENVYGRKNVFQYVWNPKTNRLDELKQIGFFPFGGFKIEF
jgi:hypothetical protein